MKCRLIGICLHITLITQCIYSVLYQYYQKYPLSLLSQFKNMYMYIVKAYSVELPGDLRITLIKLLTCNHLPVELV